jgi:hypothetical protein
MWDTEYCHLSGLCDITTSQSTMIGAIPMPPPCEASIPQLRRQRVQLTMKITEIDQMQRF